MFATQLKNSEGMMAAIKTDGFLVAIDVFQRNDGVISTNLF